MSYLAGNKCYNILQVISVVSSCR